MDEMGKGVLSILLLAAFLSAFVATLPITPVRAITPDVTFIAYDHSGEILPSYGCEWHIIFPNSTYRSFTGNVITLEDLPCGDYDVSIKWLGSWVVHNYTWNHECVHSPEYCVLSTKVTDVTFTANDHAGNPLYDAPCHWYITYPNGTTGDYNWCSGTLKLGNGTYKLGIKWQGTYVISNYTWTKTTQTSYSINCTQIVDRTFEAEDSSGNRLWPGATRIYVTPPNGTSWYTSSGNSSSFTMMKVGNGTYAVRVMFEGSKVFEWTGLMLNISEHVNRRMKCDVYEYNPVLRDQDGGTYSGANITLLCPNGTTTFLITDQEGIVRMPQIQGGPYSIPEVVYNGHKVNQTGTFSIDRDLDDWTIQFNGLSIGQVIYPETVHLDDSFTIKAQLVYSYSGEPVPEGSYVGLLGASEIYGVTDSSGWATFELSESHPAGPFTLFGVNESEYGLTYKVENKSAPITWIADFSVQALDAKGFALDNATVEIFNKTDTYWETLYTDSTGSINVEGAVCQKYSIFIRWQGVYVGSVTIDLDDATESASVPCAVYYWNISVTHLNGTAIPGASVILYWPDGTVYGTYQTNEEGGIPQIQQIPGETYKAMLNYTGATFGETYDLHQNLETEISVAFVSCQDVPDVERLCYSTSSDVLSATYDEELKGLKMEVSGTTGTPGEVEVFVPKTLLDNLGLTTENIHVFIGGEPATFATEAYPEGYLLRMSYTHSSQVIEVVFSDVALTTRVMDSNGRAISGAHVKIYREGVPIIEGHSDEDGNADFTNLATGDYEVEAFHMGILVNSTQLTLSDYDEHYSYDLNCTVYDLTVRVFDLIPSPLPGASVTASLTDGTAMFSGTTNGGGNVTFYQAPKADYEIKATYFGVSSSTGVALTRNILTEVHILMLNMTTLVLGIAVVGAALTLIGAYYSGRPKGVQKRRRGRPRKVRGPI